MNRHCFGRWIALRGGEFQMSYQTNNIRVMYQRNHIEQDQCQRPENASQIQLRQEFRPFRQGSDSKGWSENKSNPFSPMIFNITEICGTCSRSSFWTIAFRYIQIGFYWVECIENSKYRKTWWLGRSSRVNPNLGHKHASDRQCRRPKIPVKLGASFWCFALQTKQAMDRSWNLAFLTLHSSKGDVSCLPSTSTLSNFKLGEVGEVENSWISTPSRTKDPWPARMARRWVTSSECMLEEWHVGGTDFAFALMQCELSFLAWTCAEHVDLMGAQLQRKEPQVL